jgi:putative ABC transport system ATP-binding protein
VSDNVIVRAEGLSKLYRRGSESVRALWGADLEVARGQFVAVVGASGSGKTTLLNLLGCLDRPSSGSYHLNGREVAGLPERRLVQVRRREVGFVFQQFHLIPTLTVRENVQLPRVFGAQAEDRTDELIERVGLAKRSQHLPRQLSGGEMQRVAIARALANHPALLLADEPTGNLDTTTGGQVVDMLRGLSASGLAVVLVTHNPAIARQADQVFNLTDGLIRKEV